MTNTTGLNADRGAALIGVLWIVILLAILSLGVLHLTLRNRQSVDSLEASSQASQVALSAVELFVRQRFKQSSTSFVETAELEIGGIIVDVSSSFEAGKIDLNKADQDLISAVFAFHGQDEDTAIGLGAAVADWRDFDDDRRQNGAERDSYASGEYSYAPRNAPFETVGELGFVFGMAETNAFCLSEYFTTYSDPSISEVTYPLAPSAVIDILAWARQNDWQGGAWPTPDLFEEDIINFDIENKAVEISTSFNLGSKPQRF